jgi:hypothetical protein
MYPLLGSFTNKEKYVTTIYFLGFGQNLQILNAKTVTLSRQFVAVKRTY